MAEVTISIDDKAYRMACDPGQEQHLAKLGARFDAYVSHLRQTFGEIGDQRLLVMAAMIVLDELHDTETRLEQARLALASATEGGSNQDAALSVIAERLESLTNRLNGRPVNT